MHSRCGTQGARPECSNDEPGKRYPWEPDVPLAILEPDEEGFIAGRASLHKALHPPQTQQIVTVSSALSRYAMFLLGNDVILSAVQTLKKTAGWIEDPVE